MQKERHALDPAAGGAAHGPARQGLPFVGARLEDIHRGDGERRRVVFQKMVEKRSQQMQPEVLRSVAAKFNRTDGATIEPFLVMKPGPCNQEYF